MSATSFTSESASSCSMNFSPKPSMSMARREAKCLSLSRSCAGQAEPHATHRHLSGDVHHLSAAIGAGQGYGARGLGPLSLLVRTRTTAGITSPARSTMTVSPLRMSFLCISSQLCSVARETMTPETSTGARCATGVTTPVRPTCGTMS